MKSTFLSQLLDSQPDLTNTSEKRPPVDKDQNYVSHLDYKGTYVQRQQCEGRCI
jgi:hypothetical protein